MGSLFKPSQQKTTSSSTPWAPQGDQLKNVFGEAQNIYNSQQGSPFYQGDLYAKMNPMTDQGIQAGADYATGAGADASSNILNAGQGLLGAGQQGLGAFDTLFGAATADPTQANINAAGQYADNPYMDGMVDAAGRDVMRNLTENQIPGLNMAATGSGNMNSSRAGVAQGIMERGAADRIGDISAALRGSAYSQGLGLAEQGRESNMGYMGQAANGYGNVFGQGLGASQQGQNMTYQNTGALTSGGQLYQQDQQGQNNADFQQWMGQDQRASDLLNRYYGIVGGNNWGGTATGSTPGASLFQQLLGGAATAGGLAMGL